MFDFTYFALFLPNFGVAQTSLFVIARPESLLSFSFVPVS